MDRLKELRGRLEASGAWRGWKRYGDAKGNLLAGGVTYFAFLSIFPALALAFTVFGLVLRGQPHLLTDIRTYLDGALPGFIQDESGKGLIPLTVPSSTTLGVTGAVGLAGLLWSGLGWLSALRDGIRVLFGVVDAPGNVVTDKLRDLGVMVVFGVGILASAVVTVVANAIARFVAGWVGLDGQGWIFTLIGIVVGVLLDTALVGLMLRLLSGVRLSWPALRTGALVGGLGLTVLKVLGTRLVAGTMSNPVYGSIALVVGLLVWLNLMSRVVLLSAAWTANDLDAARAVLEPGTLSSGAADKLREGPERRPPHGPADVAAVTARDRAAQGLPTFGTTRAGDRATLAAGALLGALGSAALGGAVRSAYHLARGDLHRRPR